ncbi:hypothetical protein [Flavobacterium indicum]|uniref:hypothetical protein n=1 Tax=Flavobacterium indicum TaxID=312277 RepID=UPI00030AA720|nr:hypothetical protein [Flavobacterium indicum]
MEKLIIKSSFLIISLIFLSCKSSKKLIYVLPIEVEKKIYEEVLKYKIKDFFIKLESCNDEMDIFIIPTENIQNDYISFFKITDSNRLIRINDKLYFLVFKSDEKFGTEIKEKEIQSIAIRELLIELSKEEKIQGVKRKHVINDAAIHLKFKNNILVN